jgi:hypothetical protein
MDMFGMILFVIGGTVMGAGLALVFIIGLLYAIVKFKEMSDNGRDSD